MELDFVLLADGATPRPDGKLDIFGATWDTIYATSVPALHRQVAVAVRVFVEPDEAAREHEVTVTLHSADGVLLAGARGDLGAVDDATRVTLDAARHVGAAFVLNFEGLMFPDFGDYEVRVSWDGEVIRTLPIYVERAPAVE